MRAARLDEVMTTRRPILSTSRWNLKGRIVHDKTEALKECMEKFQEGFALIMPEADILYELQEEKYRTYNLKYGIKTFKTVIPKHWERTDELAAPYKDNTI
jgi:hypothetical protein